MREREGEREGGREGGKKKLNEGGAYLAWSINIIFSGLISE